MYKGRRTLAAHQTVLTKSEPTECDFKFEKIKCRMLAAFQNILYAPLPVFKMIC